MWPLSQRIELSIDGQLSEFLSSVEKHSPTKTVLTKLEKQEAFAMLKFQRTQARGIYAETDIRVNQQGNKILIQGNSKIPLGHFLLSLYFPIILLFLLTVFKNILFMIAFLSIGFFCSLIFIYLSFTNLKRMQEELMRDFETLPLNEKN